MPRQKPETYVIWKGTRFMAVHTPLRPTPVRRRRTRRRRRRFSPGLLIAAAVLLGIAAAALVLLVSAISSRSKGYDKGQAPWCIGLDAGHGGSDPGAVGLISEADMTEATVQALQALLEADDRFTVVLCREMGETVERPSQRAIRGNELGADLLLSIHGNSDATGEGYGFECYPVTPGNELADPSRELAECLAAAFESAGAGLRGDAGIRYAYYEGENSDSKVIREGSDMTVYEAPTFGFLEYAQAPAVLAEQCFVTNSEDVALLGSGEGIQRAAQCYYEAICAFFEVEPLA